MTGELPFDSILGITKYQHKKRLVRSLLLERKLRDRWPELDQDYAQTHDASHVARRIREHLADFPRALIISFSGDGGFHLVANAIKAAQTELPGLRPIALPYKLGNANDQARSLGIRRRGFVDLLARGRVQPIDLIKVTVTPANGDFRPVELFVHAYWGLGLTGRAASLLSEDLTWLSDLKIFAQAIAQHRSFSASRSAGSAPMVYDSITGHLAGRMSRWLKNPLAQPSDGRFELKIIARTWAPRTRLTVQAMAAATVGLRGLAQVATFALWLPERVAFQADGEYRLLPARSQFSAEIAVGALTTLAPPTPG